MKKYILFFIFAAVMLIISASLGLAISVNDVIAYYKMDNDTTSGNISADSTMLYNASLRWGVLPGFQYKIKEAYFFDGINDTMNTSISPNMTNSSDSFSVCGWINATYSSDSSGIFGTLDPGNKGFGVHFYINGTMRIWTGEAHYTNFTLRNETSVFVCFVRNTSSSVEIYVNATKRLSYTDNWTDSANNLTVGNIYSVQSYIGEGSRGVYDEFGIYNISLSQSDITELFNSGIGLSYPFTPPFMDVSLLTANSTHKNYFSVDYIFSGSEPDAVCYLNINGTDYPGETVLNNTLHTYTDFMLTGTGYSYTVTCENGGASNTSENRTLIIDTVSPVIFIYLPNIANSSVFGYITHINFTANDSYIYKVNSSITAFNGTVLWNDYSGELMGTDHYSVIRDFSGGWPPGNYTLFIEAADSHTANDFKESVNIIESTPEKTKLSLSSSTVEFSQAVSFEKQPDRFTFSFTPEKAGDNTIIFKSDKKLTEIKGSEYVCHYVFGRYWIDFDGLEGARCRLTDEYSLSVEYTAKDEKETVITRSLGGLNEINITVLFSIDTGLAPGSFKSPNGTVIGYTNISYNPCIPATDSIISNYSIYLYNGSLAEIHSGTETWFNFSSSLYPDGEYSLFGVCSDNYTAAANFSSEIFTLNNIIELNLGILSNLSNNSVVNSVFNPYRYRCSADSPVYLWLNISANGAETGYNITSNTDYSVTSFFGSTVNPVSVMCWYNSTDNIRYDYTVYYDEKTEQVNYSSLFIPALLISLCIALIILGYVFGVNILILISGLGFVIIGLTYFSAFYMKFLMVIVGGVFIIEWGLNKSTGDIY